MTDTNPFSKLMGRLTELADARGDISDGGSGFDGVWTGEIADIDHDRHWFVALNTDGKLREYRVDGRTVEIDPYNAHCWWETLVVAPAAIVSLLGSRAHQDVDELDRSVEDQLILSIEAALEELDHDFEATKTETDRE